MKDPAAKDDRNQKSQKNDDSSIAQPNAGAGAAEPTQASQYQESQNDEIQVLKSIFMDDFDLLESKGAWSKKADKSFKIRLRVASQLADQSVVSAQACLMVTLTATYPKTLPLLSIRDSVNLQQTTLKNLELVLSTKPKELLKLDDVMILEVANEVERVMQDAVDARAKGLALPSLEEERAAREAELVETAQREEQNAIKRQQEEEAEEDRAMQRMLEKERKRQEEVRLKRTISERQYDDALYSGKGDVTFDQEITVSPGTTHEVAFREISIRKILSSSPRMTMYEVVPLEAHSNKDHQHRVPSLVLKRAQVTKCQAKKSILDLEDVLEKLKTLRHPSTISVYDFKIAKAYDNWQFDILTDLGHRGCLVDMIQLFGNLPLQRARSSAIELLEALDYYHKNGLLHGSVSPRNVLICENAEHTPILKLADAAISYNLRLIDAETVPKSGTTNKPAAWICPEAIELLSSKTRKSDMWDFGVLLLQMLIGLDVRERYSSPASFLNTAGLTEPLQDLLRELFRSDPKRRSSAFEVLPCEFLRTEVDPFHQKSVWNGQKGATAGRSSMHHSNSELDGSTKAPSRFSNEFDETGHIGKGGFGEVVKARNKLDGRIYAIKKIVGKTQVQLTEVLSEVRHLATLNHPYVVRYYQVWQENEDPSGQSSSENSQTTSTSNIASASLRQGPSSFGLGYSTGALDFISSSGYPKIEFGDDDDDDNDEDDDDEDEDEDDASNDQNDNKDSDESVDLEGSSSMNGHKQAQERPRRLLHRHSSAPQRVATTSTLFIQMEYCERRTLRGLINKDIYQNVDEVWRLFRQILEGLVHIHSLGIIHRDLKPENIFLGIGDNPKIGDFGLATVGQYSEAKHSLNPRLGDSVRSAGDDMTRNIGTAMYVAPELRTNSTGTYSDKVDMYSLGIIFFEMCHPLKTGMERGELLGALRSEKHTLPEEFREPEKSKQGLIIESLLRHKPSERPTSSILLRSGMLPVRIEDEQIRLALQSVSDPNSPYYHRMMSALFSPHPSRQITDQMWDMEGDASVTSTNYMLLQSLAKEKLVSVFRRHGAVETSRQGLIPRSDYYTSNNVAELLDRSGALVQLPFDLTLPHARKVAQQTHIPEKTFAFGMVFREASTGVAPRSIREADFDIVSYDSRDLALKEAEILKVLDEVLDEFPAFSKIPMCFHLSHSSLLDIILEFCRVQMPQRQAAKEILGKLNIHSWTWQKIRAELRSPSVGISLTSIDELAQFDFRDTVEKSFARLQAILVNTPHLEKLHSIFTHISGLQEYLKRSGLRRNVYLSPLSNFSDKFYQGSVMFQLLYDTYETKKRDVLAAGGRYDHLVEDHRPRFPEAGFQRRCHAVGINIAWDRLVTSMARYQKHAGNQFLKKSELADSSSQWAAKRCDVLIASFDSTVLRSIGWKMVNDLWAHDISAELAVDTRAPEELLSLYREDKHSWIIIIKHDVFASGKPDLKIKSMDKRDESDVRSSELISYLRAEIRERNQREGTHERSRGVRSTSQQLSAPSHEKKAPVQVLMANHKSKKVNKWRVVEAAQASAKDLVATFNGSPIASIETRDRVLEMMQYTKLSDPESWRKMIQEFQPSARQYLTQVYELLDKFRIQHGDTTSTCFVYNFQTGKCIYYDLHL